MCRNYPKQLPTAPDESRKPATRVLAVDDDPAVLGVITDALRAAGYDVAEATSGEEGMEVVRAHQFDLALCDLCLPGMSGLDFAHAASTIHPQMPIVLITAFGDVEEGKRALAAGASDFVTKPLDLGTLPIVLENNIQRKSIEARKLCEHRADVLFKAIKALAAAIDAKSSYTGRHSARMAELCVAIGVELDLSPERLNTLELAAHIHDVGKIGTPDAVLANPGELSDDEWTDILRHPAMGADFLAGIEELTEVASIVRHHHEHMDGTGYPDGLKGDAVPFLARILAVADAYEAITSDRPYRSAASAEHALEELRANVGTQFDLDVVGAACRVIAKWRSEQDGKKAA